ncbi:GNAT family N-acetyltransferase [Rummeliibacillus suwonensis]|uniref:GNAT family N-acetyltransferase n=1 Tax=Rummeliibacillus suwonensis TaxID=1306154 RepID=UPI001AAEA1F4|nr:GNAT family N-acetyltransferase [Rummeliibacillus suwonensis]MBO2536743.1 GNAT family N-acetyltransferase [Rummeliibacillus suwonensis]
MSFMRMDRDEVFLDFYKDQYKEELSNYRLTNEQIMYSGLPMESINECKQDPERHPVVILYDHRPVGFLVLHGWSGVRQYSQNQNALLLRAFSVNGDFQGKGIATKSLQLLDTFIKKHFPKTEEVILAVNHKNNMAQHIYKKVGYVDKGMRAMGKYGEMLILSKALDETVAKT